jgi:hypothetical protein
VRHDPEVARVTRRAWSPNDLEKSHQKMGVALLRQLGYRVWTLNQNRASNVAPGVPDVLAIHPRHGLLFGEAKGRTGHKQSPKQKDFQSACDAGRVQYVCGDIDALKRHLGIPIAAEAAA